MEYAGFWSRCGALIIDIMVYIFISIGLNLILSPLDITNKDLVLLLLLLAIFCYHVVMETSQNKATIGQIVCGVEVADYDGNKITLLKSFLRTILYLLPFMPLGFVLSTFTTKKQALHDYITKTIIIKKEESIFWITFIAFILLLLIIFLVVALLGLLIEFLS